MQLLAVSLVALAWTALTSGTAISRSTAKCEGAVPVHSEHKNGVLFTTYACPDGAHRLNLTNSVVTRDTTANVDLFARQFQNCAGGAADTACECQVLCGPLPFCYSNGNGVPTQSDCQTLSNGLSGITGSFYVNSGYYVTASSGTCELVWANEATTTKEYCYQNLASLTSATWVNCMELKGGRTGGCIGDDFNYFFEILYTGSTIIVP